MLARRLGTTLLPVAAIVAACGAAPEVGPAAPERSGAGVVTSNVLREDYAGSKACEPCHAAIYAKWAASPMRRMTRTSPEAAIHAPFDGTVFRFHGDTVTVEEHEGRKYMRVSGEAPGEKLYRVTKVIGGRYREDFVGREVSGTDAGSPAVGDPRDEPVLPISWLLFSKSWRYKGYSVMVKERPRLGKRGAPWKQTCIFCHNTAPYLATIYDDLLGGKGSYQGSVSDRLLPQERVWSAHIVDPEGLRRAAIAEMAHVDPGARPDPRHGPIETIADAMNVTRERFGEEHLVEVGIGCEACHNGAREHARNPTKMPSFEPRSALFTTRTPSPVRKGDPDRAEWINHTCARCHTVLFSRYPYTWEGGARKRDPGGSAINSGEARDYLLGGCASKMACTACHDPHAEDAKSKLDALGTVAGNATCTGCHAKYEGEAARGAHTHHAVNGEGSACLSCHMPKKNAGLAYGLTRYHRIGSPTDRARVEKDRPLECALCHADRTVESLVATMERWWGKTYDRGALRGLYGADLAVSPVVATVTAGRPHEQMTAAAVLGGRGARGAAALIVPLLGSEYPLVRYWGRQAIEELLKKRLPVDVEGSAGVVEGEARAWVEAALREGSAGAPR